MALSTTCRLRTVHDVLYTDEIIQGRAGPSRRVYYNGLQDDRRGVRAMFFVFTEVKKMCKFGEWKTANA